MTIQPDSHLKVGMKAPDFSLPSTPGGEFTLSDELKKGPVFVYFFVSDFGPLCNIVMKKFHSHKDEFKKAGVQFVGISVDDTRMHGVWKERLKIDVRLLSDEEGEVSRSYGVLMEDELYFKISNRAIFLVDSNGIIRYRWVAKDPAYEPDYDSAFEALKQLAGG